MRPGIINVSDDLKTARKRIEAAFSILHHTPHLKALELYLNAYYVEFEAVSYVRTQNHSHQWDIVYALGSNRNPLPELQTLIFSGWAVAPEFASLFDEAPIAWLTTSLRHLKFSLPKGCEGTYTWEERKLYWKQVVVPRVLQPAANLESLEVTGYQHGQGSLWPEEQYLDISQLPTYPRLAALSLKNIIWEGTIGERNIATPSPLEDFIVHHSKTLKKLELHNCLILVDNRSGPPPFYCADIYTHLAKALTNLVDLEVSLDIERYEIPYATGRSYDSLTSLVGKERDALALEEFKTTVKNRGIGGFDREAN